MTPLTPRTDLTKNFDEVLEGYGADARKRYNEARAVPPAAPALTAATAGEELMSAFTRLSVANQLQSDQRSRAGFDAVVDLMKTTADSAHQISELLVSALKANPRDAALIDSLRDALDVLARLSPSAVWTASSGSAKRA